MLPQTLLSLLSLSLCTSAHFLLDYPPARGFDEDKLGEGPCGSQPVTNNRTTVSMTSIPVALTLGHDQTAIQILLGLGNDPDSNFNITLRQTFGALGEGTFCLPSVELPASLNITDGMNATLQVVTSGEEGGGLYNCADITFTSTTKSIPSSCTNGTGVTASAFPSAEAIINANDSLPTGGAQSAASGSASTSASVTASTSTPQPTAGAPILTAAWGLLAVAFVGVVALI